MKPKLDINPRINFLSEILLTALASDIQNWANIRPGSLDTVNGPPTVQINEPLVLPFWTKIGVGEVAAGIARVAQTPGLVDPQANGRIARAATNNDFTELTNQDCDFLVQIGVLGKVEFS